MEFEQRQNLTGALRQEQVMTHHQIQALELLFQPVLELQGTIDSELEKNPILETDFDVDDSKRENQAEICTDDEEWLNRILKLDEESRYIRSKTTHAPSQEEEERRQHYMDSITVEPTFQESLLEQLKFMEADDATRQTAEVVISGLDDNGYLTSHPADLAMVAGTTVEQIEAAIKLVQEMEPAGVGAKNLAERLMIQLERKGMADTKVYEAVRDHLDDIANNRLPQVAKKMNLSMEELKEIIASIQTLTPRVSNESVSPHEYVREEVDILEENGELKVKMHNDYLPSLRISSSYRELLKDPNTTKEAREYIKDKIRAGVFLINSVIQRQSTITRIVNAIVDWQKDYFLKGSAHLRPMTMAQIAEIAGIHETTVSRAAANKYLRCKHGLVSLRQFFSTGYDTADGTEVSNNVVKSTIREMIDSEDKAKPLSDSEISEQLKAKGFQVARRTVAKYREAMNILPSNIRKEY